MPATHSRLVSHGGALYVIAAHGTPVRLRDVAFHAPKHRRLALGDRSANERFFVGRDGTKRVYHLRPTSDRALTLETLAAQLRESGFLGVGPPHEPPADPR